MIAPNPFEFLYFLGGNFLNLQLFDLAKFLKNAIGRKTRLTYRRLRRHNIMEISSKRTATLSTGPPDQKACVMWKHKSCLDE
jgi:hypothetical protein